MNLNIFSHLRRPSLVAGKSLSSSTNINSVIEKIKFYIMSNRIRSPHMQSVTIPYHFTIIYSNHLHCN